MKKYPAIITGALLPIYVWIIMILLRFLPYEAPSDIIMLILCAISGVATTLCLTKDNLLDFCTSLILLILAIVVSFIIYAATHIFDFFINAIHTFDITDSFIIFEFFYMAFICVVFCAIGSIVAGGISLYRQLTTKKHEQ